MKSFLAWVCAAFLVLLVPGAGLAALIWFARNDGYLYLVRCPTCDASSGWRWYQWTAQRWAEVHVRKNPECGRRSLIGNREVMR